MEILDAYDLKGRCVMPASWPDARTTTVKHYVDRRGCRGVSWTRP